MSAIKEVTMNKSEIIDRSRALLKEAASSALKKLGDLHQKDSLNSYIPERMAFAYKVLGEWEKSREMLNLSQKIEEKLMRGNRELRIIENANGKSENPHHHLISHGFLGGVFSGLIHPIAFCHHLESFKDVLSEPRFSDRFLNMMGRFCGGFPSAFGLVYSFSQFYDDPRVFLPLSLSLVATNSASAYHFLCKSMAFKFRELDDDSLVGFYKAFKGDLGGAYTIFEKKNERTFLLMIGDFYLDEAERDIGILREKGLLNSHIMNLLMKRPLDIYTKFHDATNLRRIASDYANNGFEDFAENSLRQYYEMKSERVKHDITNRHLSKPIYHLTQEIRDTVIKECEEMCLERYKDRSLNTSYTPRKELKLYEALSLMDCWDGERNISYFMLKAQIYRLLGFRKSAERCESAVKSIELNRITIEEKAKTLKKFKRLQVHTNPVARLKSKKSMEIRGYLSEEAINFLSK